MKPVLDLTILIPILIALLGFGIFASWRSTYSADSTLRKLLIGLRTLSMIGLAVFLLNPGKWVDKADEKVRFYPIMIDDSASMAVKSGEISRSEEAVQIYQAIEAQAKQAEITVKPYSFSDDVIALENLDSLSSDAKSSNFHFAGTNLFTKLQADGDAPEAILVLSDGRQTEIDKHSTLALQSRATNAPIYAISIGDDVVKKDLMLSTARNTITAFPKQNLQVTAILKNHNLGNQAVNLKLTDAAGKKIDEEKIELKNNEKLFHTFSVKAPESSTRYTLSIEKVADEQLADNNEVSINVRILKTKTRVFIAEGAPYWDSKFLAQLLRQQSHMEVHSVHRLSDERWFRIDSGESKPSASSEDVFPTTAEELSHYDLIIFGKNSEHFLNAERIESLKAYVRDQGGAVLFARGKPYSGRLEALESLEPVNWANGNTSSFNISPTEDGQAVGLFGQALPKPDSPVWKSLPKLKDAHNVESVKPFTRVLAEGSITGTEGKFPLLLVRRYGQGVCGLVNADGLWKWDFYPEARELGNMYQEFWTQLIQWKVAYSEFLPGHDYSLHASNQSIEQDEPVVFSLSYRGTKKDPKPSIELSLDGEEPIKLIPAESSPVAGKPAWKSSFVPTKPGSYTITAVTDDGSPSPLLNLEVKAPPAERDNLNPDPTFLQEICESTGGKLLKKGELNEFLKEKFSNKSTQVVKAETVWQPSWMKWFMPIIVLCILAAEWWLRRRNGLV